MNRLLFIVAVCLALTANSQTDSAAIKVSAQLRELSNTRKYLVNKIDKSTSFKYLYDTLLNCGDGCEAGRHFYYSYAYDSLGRLQKVKVFDDKTKTLKEYYYSNNRVLQVNSKTFLLANETLVSTSNVMVFDVDYNSVGYVKANADNFDHLQTLVEGYKLLVRFYDLINHKT